MRIPSRARLRSSFRSQWTGSASPFFADESVAAASDAIVKAASEKATIICFPEVYVPGYRIAGRVAPPADVSFLNRWAEEGSYRPTSFADTSAVARPDGTVLAWQPDGQAGLLLAEIETDEATGWLASRYRLIGAPDGD